MKLRHLILICLIAFTLGYMNDNAAQDMADCLQKQSRQTCLFYLK
jgi:hypothetical protein